MVPFPSISLADEELDVGEEELEEHEKLEDDSGCDAVED